jgi:hypothetical protein
VSGKFYCPADELLDLPAGALTVSLAQRALRLSTMMGFQELQDELQAQHDVSVTDTTLDALMNRAGGVAEADRQQALEELAAQPVGQAREQAVAVQRTPPGRMYVSCDGITYRTRYRVADPEHAGQQCLSYQEMKVGTVFWQDERQQWHKQVVSGRDDPARFGLSLWRLAVACGMLACPEVIFISDGGGWCNTVAETYFQETVRILDWYHLSEHVWAAGRALYGPDEKAAARWVADALDYLHEHSGIGLLRHLERCLAARGPSASTADREALEALLGYVRPRLAITEYVAYRAKGYVIGSGMMESTCKQVVGRRLKGSGMQWSEPGALAMTALIGLRINGSWANFWKSRPLQRAA